jgi:hypothetical protein
VVNKCWIDTDIHASETDDIHALIYALVMHLQKRVEIVGISIGWPRGEMKLAEKVFKAFEKDGFKVSIPLYQGAKKPYGAGIPKQTIHALWYALHQGALFCAWGSLTTFAEASSSLKKLTPLHAITSWNREQDKAAYSVIKAGYSRFWIDNEKDFRRIYQGWPVAKNRAWVKKIASMMTPNVRRLWLDAAAKTNTGKDTFKGGDIPSLHWAIHYDGGPMKYVTRRKKILDEFTEEVESLFGKGEE